MHDVSGSAELVGESQAPGRQPQRMVEEHELSHVYRNLIRFPLRSANRKMEMRAEDRIVMAVSNRGSHEQLFQHGNMKILVTGSAGHLGEALMRTLEHSTREAIGVDIKRSPFTHRVGSIAERSFVNRCMEGVDAVLHAATLHKPHIATHSRQDFVDTNVTGTLNLLEEAATVGVSSFVFTSTTSTFGHALTPPAGAPAAWITEEVTPVPKNIYGVTKLAAENVCELVRHSLGLPCIVLRTSRFFPEADDDTLVRRTYENDNLKVSELLYRRADIEDVVSAHLLALQKAAQIGFGRYIISATTPFTRDDLAELRADAPAVVRRPGPSDEEEFARPGWSMVPTIDRVYVNELARVQLGWQPRHDFGDAIRRLRANEDYRSSLARAVGSKGYHRESFANRPYPTD
jgi:UDP-glucose 4-epimerase